MKVAEYHAAVQATLLVHIQLRYFQFLALRFDKVLAINIHYNHLLTHLFLFWRKLNMVAFPTPVVIYLSPLRRLERGTEHLT